MSCSLHMHYVKDEVMLIVSGQGTIEVGPIGESRYDVMRTLHVAVGDTVHIPRQTIHRITGGPAGMALIEFSTHHEDGDSIRFPR